MQAQTPTFFVPGVRAEDLEQFYTTMADACGYDPPNLERRIYSIVYEHDGVVWTAAVGKQLQGMKTTIRSGREQKSPLSDAATVLGIFPGNPWKVVTNKGPIFGNARSMWENPFMAGKPTRFELFRRM